MGVSRVVWPGLLAGLLAVTAAVASEGSAHCTPLPPLAGEIGAADRAREQAFCAIDFSGSSTALCPKTWSTSPAALVYDLAGTPWEERAPEFEAQVCARGGSAREEASRELAFFKNSLNGRETSGTFAPASLLYYHFSRLLETRLRVPVAVPVSFPAASYRERLVTPGVAFSSKGRKKMLHEGWLEMERALAAPQQYSHQRELFIDDGERLWGVLLLVDGRRYGPEVNGTRASGWGEGQNRDFQRTAPFIALRTDAPLAEAVSLGVAAARKDPAMAKALTSDASPSQIAWWMHEITEIVLLDYILGQQDRVGNVDYRWRWLWQENGVLHGADAAPAGKAQKLRVTVLNDNDAGVRSGYANYAGSTGMLQDWHHMDAGLYRRVQALAEDFRNSGDIASAVRSRYRLSAHEAQAVIKRGVEAADYLRKRCREGALRFDLDVASVLYPENAVAAEPDCFPAGASGGARSAGT